MENNINGLEMMSKDELIDLLQKNDEWWSIFII